MPKVVLLIESILGERSRTVARIKRENFHRGVSCLEPLAPAGGAGGEGGEGVGGVAGDVGGPEPPVRGVSWDETVKVKERPQSSVETREETDKLRDLISIRRGSAQLEPARPVLTRGSSVTTQHVLKTSERPPLARGFSCQTRRPAYNYPAITLSRPSNNTRPLTMLEQPKIDLLSAVSEIHDNLKENTATALTEEETEDEFHEEMQGGPLLLLLLLHLLA